MIKKYSQLKSQIVWHGSPFLFDTFKTHRRKRNYSYNLGAYFSTSKKEAKNYGKVLYRCEIVLQKPLDLTHISEDSREGWSLFLKILDDLGFFKSQRVNKYVVLGDYSFFGYAPLEQFDSKYALVPFLKKKKYDGILFNEGSGVTVVVFNPSAIKILDVDVDESWSILTRYSQLKKASETLVVSLPGKYVERKIPVYKNPSPEAYTEIAKRFREEFPFAPKGEPKSRHTYDEKGNEYLWMSGDAMHYTMENALYKQYGIKTHQIKGELPEGKFDDYS